MPETMKSEAAAGPATASSLSTLLLIISPFRYDSRLCHDPIKLIRERTGGNFSLAQVVGSGKEGAARIISGNLQQIPVERLRDGDHHFPASLLTLKTQLVRFQDDVWPAEQHYVTEA